MSSDIGRLAPNEFPYDVENELGRVLRAEQMCPGVYDVAVTQEGSRVPREIFLVCRDAAAISGTVKARGVPLRDHPELLTYDPEEPETGKFLVQYEAARYQRLHHIPLPEDTSLENICTFGREFDPEYFGAYQAPVVTPWGAAARYQAVDNGVYWIETEDCRETLAVSYPLYEELTFPVIGLSRAMGPDVSWGRGSAKRWRFFEKQDMCLPVFELMETRPHWADSGKVDRAALMNAILTTHGAYAAAYNAEEEQWLEDRRREGRAAIDRRIVPAPSAGTEYLHLDGK